MPIYEYQCKACGCKFEALQKVDDKPLQVCPKCDKEALEKCVSLTSFQLKGKGWYETDFKAKKKPEIKSAKKEDAQSSSEKKHIDKDKKSEVANKKEKQATKKEDKK